MRIRLAPSLRPAAAALGGAMALGLLSYGVSASPQGTPPSPPAGAPPAGRPAAPPPPKNLQFFPKDMPRPDLIQTMRQFSFALGVGCEHCHVDEEGGANPREDFASDEKPAKVKARAMLQMTKQLNDELLTKIPNRSKPPLAVTCATCHHGLPKPETLTAHLKAAAAANADSAVAELGHLREQAEFGRFDVSEWGVNEAARALSTDGNNDAALALLRANATYHPESTAIPAMMAEVQVARGDKAAAIEILRKLVAADPDNRRAKRMLDQLEGAAPQKQAP